jgi:hypothetical protein
MRGSNVVRIEGEVVIARSATDVFDVVADERNEPRYNPRMVRADKLSVGPIGAGTKFRAEVETMGSTREMLIELTEYDRPRRLASSTHMSSFDVQGTLTFAPTGDATRMAWSWQLKPHGALRLMTPLLGLIGRRQERATWASLKRYLEGADAPATPVVRSARALTPRSIWRAMTRSAGAKVSQ